MADELSEIKTSEANVSDGGLEVPVPPLPLDEDAVTTADDPVREAVDAVTTADDPVREAVPSSDDGEAGPAGTAGEDAGAAQESETCEPTGSEADDDYDPAPDADEAEAPEAIDAEPVPEVTEPEDPGHDDQTADTVDAAEAIAPDASADAVRAEEEDGLTTPVDDEVEYEIELTSDWKQDTEPRASVALEKMTTTARMPAVVEAPDPDLPGDGPQLSDVADTFALWIHGRLQAAGRLLSTHRLVAALIALGCVAAILVAVLLGLDASKVPPEDLIKEDARTVLAPPSYTVSSYADDNPLVLQSVDITDIRPSEEVKDACEVEVVATFTNPGMETHADAQLVYQRKGDDWTCIESSVGSASHHATAGVNQQLVIENVGTILQKADTRSDSEGLATLYRNASIDVVSEEFSEETQSDVVVLHCSSGGTFIDYECDLTARFRFVPASGAWELAEASVSEGAYDLGFAPLLGTWHGAFSSQQSTSHKCLAARDAGLTLVITQANMTQDGSAIVEGTLSGIAHLHADVSEDATTVEGDTALENAPFSGSLHTTGGAESIMDLLAEPVQESAGIVFDCTTQDVTGGTVALTLTFGHATDPDAATATLESCFVYRDTFLLLVPYDREARFVDSFVLTKEG